MTDLANQQANATQPQEPQPAQTGGEPPATAAPQGQTQPGAPAAQVAEPQGAAPVPVEDQAPIWDESRVFFEPSELANGNEDSKGFGLNDFMQAIGEQIKSRSIQLHTWNVNAFGQWPTGAGAAVLPFTRRVTRNVANSAGVLEATKTTELVAVFVWPIFPLNTILGFTLPDNCNADGVEYLRTGIYADQANRILNPLRRQRIGETKTDAAGNRTLVVPVPDMSSVPKAVKDHVEGMATEKGELKAFNEIAKDFIGKLRALSPVFSIFSPQTLRQMLSQATIAKSFNAQLEADGFWTDLIGVMEAEAKLKGIANVSVYQRWRDTRNEGEEIDLTKINIAALS